MAKTICANREAYDKAASLKRIHSSIYRELQRELASVKALTAQNGGFYAEHTSRKINTLVNSMEQQILPRLKQDFDTSEKRLESMEQVLKEKDYF